jgi:hypothetical protein
MAPPRTSMEANQQLIELAERLYDQQQPAEEAPRRDARAAAERLADEVWGAAPTAPASTGQTGGSGRALLGGALETVEALGTAGNTISQFNPMYRLGQAAQRKVFGKTLADAVLPAIGAAAEAQFDKMAPERRAALDRPFLGEQGILFGDAPGKADAYWLKAVRSAPSIVAGIGPTALAARAGASMGTVATIGAAIEGLIGGGYSAVEAASAIERMSPTEMAVTFGAEWEQALEGAQGNEAAARKTITDKAKREATLIGGGLSSLFGAAGGAATTRILNGVGVTPAATAAINSAARSTNPVLSRVGQVAALGATPATTRLGAAGRALVPGAIQEGLQEVGEGVGSRFATHQPLLEGAAEEFVGGALLGGPIEAGVAGAVGPRTTAGPLPLEDVPPPGIDLGSGGPDTRPDGPRPIPTADEQAEFEAQEAAIAEKERKAAERAAKQQADAPPTNELPPQPAPGPVEVTPTQPPEEPAAPATPTRALAEADDVRARADDVLDKVQNALAGSRTKDEKRQAANQGFAQRIPAVRKALREGDWNEARLLLTEVSQANPRVIPPTERKALGQAIDNADADAVLTALEAIDSKLTRKRDKIAGLQPLQSRPVPTTAQQTVQQAAEIAEESEARVRVNKDGTTAKTRIVPLEERQTIAESLVQTLREAVNKGWLAGTEAEQAVRVALAEYGTGLANARHKRLDEAYATLTPLAKKAAAAVNPELRAGVVVETVAGKAPTVKAKKPRGKVTLARTKETTAPQPAAAPPAFPYLDADTDIAALQQRLRGSDKASQVLKDLSETDRGQSLRAVIEMYLGSAGKKATDKVAVQEVVEQLRQDQLAAQVAEQRRKRKAAKEAAANVTAPVAVTAQATDTRATQDEITDERMAEAEEVFAEISEEQTREGASAAGAFEAGLTIDMGEAGAGGGRWADELSLQRRNAGPELKEELDQIDAYDAAERKRINESDMSKEQKAAARDSLRATIKSMQQDAIRATRSEEDIRGDEGVDADVDMAEENDWAYGGADMNRGPAVYPWITPADLDADLPVRMERAKRINVPELVRLLDTFMHKGTPAIRWVEATARGMYNGANTLDAQSVLRSLRGTLAGTDNVLSPVIDALLKSGVDWKQVKLFQSTVLDQEQNTARGFLWGAADSQVLPATTPENNHGSAYKPGNVAFPQSALAVALDPNASDSAKMMFLTTVLHELVHIATVQKITEGGPAVDQLIALFHEARARAEFGPYADEYGFSNVFEFVSEAMTNPEFQRALQALGDSTSQVTQPPIWDRFVQAFKKLFGVTAPTSYMDRFIRIMATGQVYGQNERKLSRSPVAGLRNIALRKHPGMDPRALPRPGDTVAQATGRLRQYLPNRAAENLIREFIEGAGIVRADSTGRIFAPRGAEISSFLKVDAKRTGPPDMDNSPVGEENLPDAGFFDSTYSGARGTSLWVHSFNDIVDRFAKAFEVGGANLLRKYQAALQERNAIVTEKRRDMDKLLQRWREVIKPDKWDRFNSLLKRTTMESIDPTKPWAEQEWAKKKYSADVRRAKYDRWVTMRREVSAIGGKPAAQLYADLVNYFEDSFRQQQEYTVERLLKTEADKLGLRKTEGGETFFDHAAITALRNAVIKDPKADDIAATLVARNPELDKDSREVRDLVRSLRGVVGRQKKAGPYLPLRRYGEYVVAAERTTVKSFPSAEEAGAFRARVNANTHPDYTAYAKAKFRKKVAEETGVFEVEVSEKHVQFFEGRAAARAAEQELSAAGKFDSVYATPKNEFMQSTGNIEGASAFAEHLKSQLRKGIDGKETGITAAIDRSILQLLESNAARAAQLNRATIAGASTDMFRAIADQADATAWVMADMATVTEQSELMSRMRNHAKGKFAHALGVDPTNVVNHLNKREEYSVKRDRVGSFAEDIIARTGYYWFLASLSYSLVNMTQIVLTGWPHLVGKYGAAAGTKHFLANIGVAGKAGLKELRRTNLGFTSVPEMYMETVVGGELNVNTQNKAGALSQLTRMGLIDATFIQELHSAREPGAWGKSKFVHYATTWARSLPQLVEQFNRVAVGGAAYDAAREKGRDHTQATEEARQAVIQSQFDYSSMNRPLAFKALPFSRVIFMFKMYAQGIYSLFARHMAGVMGKGTGTRAESARFLAGYAAVNTMAAGVLGGLMTEPLRAVGALIATAMDDDDDGLTWETEFKTAVFEQARVWGATDKQARAYMDMIAYGLPRWSKDYGIDLSSRVGTAHLLFMPVMNKDDTYENAMVERTLQLLGPMGSMFRNMFKGMDRLEQGRGAEALENMMPKGMRDIAKGIRRSQDPQLSASGRETLPEMSAVQALWQGIGFSTTADARRYDEMGAQYDYESKMGKERTKLMRRFYRASPAERSEIWREEITEWNRAVARDPKLRVSYQQLMQGTKRIREEEQKSRGGMAPRLDSTQRAVPYAGRE